MQKQSLLIVGSSPTSGTSKSQALLTERIAQVIEFEAFQRLLNMFRRYAPDQRYGQAIWNLMYNLAPDVVRKYAGTPIDCFYKDSNIEVFLEAMKNEGVLV